MIIPILCQGCGKATGHLWFEYLEKVKEERAKMGVSGQGDKDLAAQGLNVVTPEGKALDEMKMRRDCCRITFMCNVDLSDKIT